MFQLIVLIFILVPVIEIYLFIQLGGAIGAANTILLIVFTAFLGAALLRHQGFATLARGRAHMDNGQLPAQELVEGLILLVCGALLLTPGFFTDAMGFLMLLPSVRKAAAANLLKRFEARAVKFTTETGQNPAKDQQGHTVIEGEYRRER